MKEKKRNYKLRAKVYKFIGTLITFLTTTSGFIAYQMYTNFEEFEKNISNFVVVKEETLKLNMTLALPFLIGLVIFVFVAASRNKEFFKQEISVDLLLIIVILYLIYSVVEVTMSSLIGALIGSILNDFIFLPLYRYNNEKFLESKEINSEFEKEKQRIRARKQVEEELNGSV